MAKDLYLAAAKRDLSRTARALRREGRLPAVVYGPAVAAENLHLEADATIQTVAEAGYNRLITLDVAGNATPHTVLIRDIQRDPVTYNLLHVDFYAVVADQKVSTEIPLVQVGVAPVVEMGGTVVQTLETLEVECLPGDMPTEITVDISGLENFGDSIVVADLPIPAGVEVLADPDMDVIHVAAPRMEEEEEEAEELEILGAEGEAAEGEEAESEEGADEEAEDAE